MENLELQIFKLIGSAGDARSLAFSALKTAREGKFEEARGLLKDAKERSLEAHEVQTSLIQAEAGGEKQELSLLMVHAQDHLMTAMLARDLIEEIVTLTETLWNK